MTHLPQNRRGVSSATVVQALWLVFGCSLVFAITAMGANPIWWSSQGTGSQPAVATEQIVTNNSGIVTTNFAPNDYAAATQGQLKQFTARAVDELSSGFAQYGGAGPALTNLVYGWSQDYATNGFATNTSNPYRPYAPKDFQLVNVGQLKYIASLIYNQLSSAGFTGLTPSWLHPNSATDNSIANLGQLKQTFNFDLSVLTQPANSVSNLTVAPSNAGEIDLSWSLPSLDNASSLAVQESTDGGTTWTTVSTMGATSTSDSVNGLTIGQSYLFRIAATNGAGSSTATSAAVSATAQSPTVTSATLGAGNSVTLAWSESNTSGVTGFTVQQSTNGGVTWAQVDSVGATQTTDTLTNLPGAMDTSQFKVSATSGSVSSILTPAITPAASSTADTDGDGTVDSLDGWAGFTDPVQEAKLAPPRLSNPSYVAVTISTIPNTYTIDFVNHQGQAVVHDIEANSNGGQSTVYYFWDKGATNTTKIQIPASVPYTDPLWGTISPVESPTGLSDFGTVIGVQIGSCSIVFNQSTGLRQTWRWTPGMTQLQVLSDLDNIDEITSDNDSGWVDFQTTPVSITSVNGVETIYAYHQQAGFYFIQNGANQASPQIHKAQSYTEVYSSTTGYQPTKYYNNTDQAEPNLFGNVRVGSLTISQGATWNATGASHESRLPSQDNGLGTVIGSGAQMDTYKVNYPTNEGVDTEFDANVAITPNYAPTNVANASISIYFYGFPLVPQPGNAQALPGGGMIVNGNYRQWVNGQTLAVNSTGYVLGMQNSISSANAVANTGYDAPYFSFIPTNNVPVPTIWLPQPATGTVTSYTAVTITMPQTGLSFTGKKAPSSTQPVLFFNKQLQIAGGYQGDPNAFMGEDVPFLWQNYQYHHLSDFFPGMTSYSAFQVKGLDDNSIITAIATPNPSSGNATPSQQVVQLLPVQLSVVSRDDPTQTWSNNTQQPMGTIVYGGIKAGDMVSWKIAGADSWSSATFTWTVTDSNGNPITDFNGTAIAGPSGTGINEWRIATWTAGGNDPHNQWLTWKPGTYNIKCVVSFAGGGTTPITFQQTVGTRANDVVAIAWINPAGVSLPTSGVDSDVLSTFPVSGTFSGPLARIFTSAYVLSLSTGATVRPVVAASLSSADDTYILNWLFHFAGNTAPPTSLADEPTLDTFVSTKTNYKLVNRLQVKWQENAAKFVGTPLQIKNGVTVSIGTTTDPIWGLPAPGSAGPANGRIRITGNNIYNQMNDGSPDAIAVAAFNTLESPNIWSDIGSMFSEGPTTGSSYTLAQQVYPTYFIYVRNSDGSFTQVDTKTQATNPSGNFSTTPYPGGLSIPSWIIP